MTRTPRKEASSGGFALVCACIFEASLFSIYIVAHFRAKCKLEKCRNIRGKSLSDRGTVLLTTSVNSRVTGTILCVRTIAEINSYPPSMLRDHPPRCANQGAFPGGKAFFGACIGPAQKRARFSSTREQQPHMPRIQRFSLTMIADCV